MAEINITTQYSIVGLDKNLAGMKRAEHQAEKLNNAVAGGGRGGRGGTGSAKKDNSGYAALALSQGVEDFSMAGMRGILNNIPQMLMFAGVAPHVAAGISLVAVAAYIGGPKLKTFFNVMEGAEKASKRADEMKASYDQLKKTLDDLDFSDWTKEQSTAESNLNKIISESATAPKKAMEDRNKLLKEQAEYEDEIASAKARIVSAGTDEFGKSLVQETAKRTALEKEIENLRKEKESADLASTHLSNSIKRDDPRSESGFMDESEFKDERAFLNVKINRLEELKKKMGDSPISKDITEIITESVIKDAQETIDSLIQSGAFKGTNFDNASQDVQMRILDSLALKHKHRLGVPKAAKDRSENMIALSLAKDEMRLLLEKKNLQDEAVKNFSESNDIRDKESSGLSEQIKLLDRQIKQKETILGLSKDEFVATRQAADALDKKNAYAAQDEQLKRLNEYAVNTMPQTGNMLSSLGKVGLSSKEAYNSLGVINMQRQANRWLSEIANNTRNGNIAKYGPR